MSALVLSALLHECHAATCYNEGLREGGTPGLLARENTHFSLLFLAPHLRQVALQAVLAGRGDARAEELGPVMQQGE